MEVSNRINRETQHACNLPGKRPCAARCGSTAPDSTEKAQDDQRQNQHESTDFTPNSRADNSRHRLSRLIRNNSCNVLKHEADRYQKDDSAGHVQQNGTNKRPGDLRRRLLDFFTHGDHHSGRRSRVGSVQESDAERPPRRSPSRLRLKPAESNRSAIPALLRNRKNRANNRQRPNESEHHCAGIQHRQPSVAIRRHSRAYKSDSQEDEVCLPCGRREYRVSVGVREDVYAADEEERGSEVYG